MRIRTAIYLAGILVGAATFSPDTTLAQSYPSRPVRIIVPFGAGGPADLYARVIGQHLQVTLKQGFIIENKPGAGGVVGTMEAARAAPDGHTLLMMSNTHAANETLIQNKAYHLTRDFVPIAPINAADLVIVVNPAVAAQNSAGVYCTGQGKAD